MEETTMALALEYIEANKKRSQIREDKKLTKSFINIKGVPTLIETKVKGESKPNYTQAQIYDDKLARARIWQRELIKLCRKDNTEKLNQTSTVEAGYAVSGGPKGAHQRGTDS